MKFLLLTVLIVGTCVAQEHHSRRYQPSQQQPPAPPQPQSQPQDDRNQQHYRPDPQQYQEHKPRTHEPPIFIPIIRFDKEQGADGSYKALWETGNNIFAQEEGYLKDLGPDPEQKGENIHAQVQQGSFKYTAPNGDVIFTEYTADETGFHVKGDHLPTPPPVSAEVQKGLDLIFAGIRQQQEQASREYSQEPSPKQGQEYRGAPRQQNAPNQIQDVNRHQNQNHYQPDYHGQRQHQ